jgi:hypothetical protein
MGCERRPLQAGLDSLDWRSVVLALNGAGPFARSRLILEHLAPRKADAMLCPEYLRLQQHYEVAIRQWGHIVLSPDGKLVGALARQAAEIRQKAFAERDLAKGRLSIHKVTCPACNPKLGAIHPAK